LYKPFAKEPDALDAIRYQMDANWCVFSWLEKNEDFPEHVCSALGEVRRKSFQKSAEPSGFPLF
jgi:hypothetical protein